MNAAEVHSGDGKQINLIFFKFEIDRCVLRKPIPFFSLLFFEKAHYNMTYVIIKK